MWAKSACGVGGLANVFAMGNNFFWHFACGVPEPNCLQQGLGPPVKPAPKPAKPRATSSAKSAAKPAAQVAAKPVAKPAAGQSICVAPVEHVQLFRVNYSRQNKWHTEPVSQ